MTLKEKREKDYKELQERKENERLELENSLKKALSHEAIELIEIQENSSDYSYSVKIAFTLDGYRQEDDFYWDADESQEFFIERVKKIIDYIKELRSTYPKFCKQNDYIQTNRRFNKKIPLTHMGYKREYNLTLELAVYLKLPNTTSYSCGGGDYEIKRTPQRVEEFNKNIDTAIDCLLDCIAELRQRKYLNK